MAGPLAAIKVIEMAHMISGPYAGMLLADQGAEVIKVELPGSGDYFRKWQTYGGQITPSFACYNRGKKSVTINTKSKSGCEIYRRLTSNADVLIENFRPGTLERYGIGYDDLKKHNSKLVYCSISGMGSSGPYRDLPSYDQMVQGMSGLWSQLTDMEKPEPVGPPICDQLTGLYALYGILGALVGRLLTGKGQKLEVSMLGSGIAFAPAAIAQYFAEGIVADKSSKSITSQSYAFVASDGKPFGVHLSTPPKFWEAFTTVAGCPEFIEDKRFKTKADRIKNYYLLHDLLQEQFKKKPRHEWLALMMENDVPAGALNDIAEAVSDPQAQHLGMVREFGDGERVMKLVGFPVIYQDTACAPGLPPPFIGEHNREVYKGLGYTDEDLLRFRKEEAI